MPADQPLGSYLDDLASNKPAPGGGSAAALAGAMGAALASMVAHFTVGREKFAEVEEEVRAALGETERLRADLTRLMDEDERAYSQVTAAYRLPRDTDEEKALRTRAIQSALMAAAEVPLEVAECCRAVLRQCVTMAEKGNPMLVSDAGVAARLAEAALQSAWLNVEINLRSIQDAGFAAAKRTTLEQLTEESRALLHTTWEKTLERM
jgi:formiminotetrahydrofolate cyclodeaminase